MKSTPKGRVYEISEKVNSTQEASNNSDSAQEVASKINPSTSEIDANTVNSSVASNEEVVAKIDHKNIGASFIILANIKHRIKDLQQQIENFDGQKSSKQFLHLQEQLTKQQEALDALHVKENVEARSMKKLSTQTVEGLFKTLDEKCNPTSQVPTPGNQVEKVSNSTKVGQYGFHLLDQADTFLIFILNYPHEVINGTSVTKYTVGQR